MKKCLMLFTFIFAASLPAYAQSDYPKFEVFGGYSFYSADVRFDMPFFDNREQLHGAAFSLAGNLTRHFGIVADFSYHQRTIDFLNLDVKVKRFNYLFGPRFTVRGRRLEGFAHALIGGTRRKADGFDSEKGLALGLGGGVDLKVADHFAVRLAQIDYLPFRDHDSNSDETNWRHNVRASVGVTLRW